MSKTPPKAKASAKSEDRRTRGSTPGTRSGQNAATPVTLEKKSSRSKTVPAAEAAPGRKSTTAKKAAPPRRTKRATRPEAPPYLAVELGTPVDPQGEPIGAGSPRAQSDRELQEYALQLWRQMQRGSVTKRYMRSMERAGITLDEVWTVGLREVWTTSSTADEMRRYRQRMLFRANLLEAIMSETIADLHRLEGIEPRDAVVTDATQPPSEPPPQVARRSQAAQRS